VKLVRNKLTVIIKRKFPPTWRHMKKDESGTIYFDWYQEGVRCLIMRGPGALCAYIGVPTGHPLSNKSYEDLNVDVHGGWTFDGEGDGKYRPTGVYWYGWDYTHCDDQPFYSIHRTGKRWMVEEVRRHILKALPEFKKEMEKSEDFNKS
jgi:hypothetical protein